MMNGKLKLTT